MENKKDFSIFKNYIPVKTKDKREWLSNEAMVVYSVVNMHTRGHEGFECYYITVDDVVRELYGINGIDTKRRKKVKDGFLQLQAIFPEVFKAADLSFKVWAVYVKNIYIVYNRCYYTYCYNQDLEKLFENEKHHLYVICGFYFKYLSTFDNDQQIGKISINLVAKALGLNEKTVDKHLRVLTKKENEVIKCIKTGYQKAKTNELRKMPDIHYRPMEENLVYNYLDTNDDSSYFI